jgi:serralysin
MAPYAIAPGQTAQGNISNTFDYDYYIVGVMAGQKYSFGLIGTGMTPMSDPILKILDSRGAEVASNDDLAIGYKWSELTYTATQTGNLTIKVGSDVSTLGGQYGLSVDSGSQFNFDYLMGSGAVHSEANSFWGPGNGLATTVTYGFRQTAASYTSTKAINAFTQLSAAEISAVNLVMSLWSDICGIKFELVNPSGYTDNAVILFGNYNNSNDPAGAFAYMPLSTNASSSGTSSKGDVWLNISSRGVSTTSTAPGSYSFYTIMHEVGHAIGLTHPGPYQASTGKATYTNDAQFVQDTGQYSIMSYFDNADGGQASGKNESNLTPMILDILALQNVYGANMTTRTDNTVYGFNANTSSSIYEFTLSKIPQLCIWDAGGIDTLNCSGYSQNQSINLNEGSFSNIGGGTANISTALNVTIENAIGGSGNDQILGNLANNLLSGGKGNDTIDGGSGIDTAIYSGVASSYTITVASGAATITDKTSNRDGIDSLKNIERLQFSDKNIALDLAATQSAGQTALLIGAVLPGKLVYDVSKQALLGSVIGLFDQNFTLSQLSGAILRLPIWDVLTGKAAPTNADIASYLVNNVYGGTQTAAITNAAIAAMNAETPATQGNYLASLAASDANQTHINLVGVQTTGLVYLV